MSAEAIDMGEVSSTSYKNRYYKLNKLDDGRYAVFVYEYDPYADTSGFVQYSKPFKTYEAAAKYFDWLTTSW